MAFQKVPVLTTKFEYEFDSVRHKDNISVLENNMKKSLMRVFK